MIAWVDKEKQLADLQRAVFLFAEREGFEPPVPLGTVVFKTTVIDHSTISPCLERTRNVVLKACAKVAVFLETCKFLNVFLLQIAQNSNFAA